MADIPGLIEGAHQGVGLGDEFLRHIERTRVVLHIIDISGSEGRDPLDDFQKINDELKNFNPQLAERVQIIAANKLDLPAAMKNLQIFQAELGSEYEIFPISAVTGTGLQPLLQRLLELVKELPSPVLIEAEERVVIKPDFLEEEELVITRADDGAFIVGGSKVREKLARTNVNNDAAVARFLRYLKQIGLYERLSEKGIAEEDIVRIGPLEFEYIEESQL